MSLFFYLSCVLYWFQFYILGYVYSTWEDQYLKHSFLCFLGGLTSFLMDIYIENPDFHVLLQSATSRDIAGALLFCIFWLSSAFTLGWLTGEIKYRKILGRDE